ncbi:uncharacterized protein LOC6524142 [Drosophila yakuba]|uniref:Kazal-like domain-containing protein n=1 Tax=Drosophila yakuba TaxID=7245 RepID=B4PZP6_DROYA|nr:uncharacterized protein LOC6524142 [Drosophila yakuba]EDX01113.1 uncharacterized protein Dyak_GE16811 [Drosophila yakuba]
MQRHQLTLMFGMALLWAVASGTTQPPSTRRPPLITTTTPRTTPRNCPLVPPVCSKASPRVCGRTPRGECQRFENICQLIRANGLGQVVGVRHTRDIDCRNVKGIGAANRRPCYNPCPARPVVCKRSPPSQHICVRSRNGRQCKVLANSCQLRNQNCHSQPRNNWLRTDSRRCGQLQLGDKPQVCIRLPVRPRITTRRTSTTRRRTTSTSSTTATTTASSA